MIGQVLFLAVFTVLTTGATTWGAQDVRRTGRLSELASLSLTLLAILGLLVFLLALSSSAGSSGLPLAARLPTAVLLAGLGVALLLRQKETRNLLTRLLGPPFRAGLVLLAAATTVGVDSGVALLLVLLGAAAARAIWPSPPAPRPDTASS